MKLTIDEVDNLQMLCNDLADEIIDRLDEMWCIVCKERRTFYKSKIQCKCTRKHSVVRCDSCGKLYWGEKKEFAYLEIYNRKQFGDKRKQRI